MFGSKSLENLSTMRRADYYQTSYSMDPRRFTLDDDSRVQIEKLEVALKFLGLAMTPEQMRKLRGRLVMDSAGTVSYGDFVKNAREIMKGEYEEIEALGIRETLNQYGRMRDETNNFKKEIDEIKSVLQDKEIACSQLEEDLLRSRKECRTAMIECQELRAKNFKLQQLRHENDFKESDFNEVIELLESEIDQLKQQVKNNAENPVIQKRMNVLNCQVKKAEKSRNLYKTTAQKMLRLLNVIEKGTVDRNSGGIITEMSPQQLINEARKLDALMNDITSNDPYDLEYGWEESYSPSGGKYYINHLTHDIQKTAPSTSTGFRH